MLQRYFKQEGYDYNEKALNNISSQFVQCDEGDDVLVGIGSGHIAVRDVFKAIYPSHQFDAPRKTSEDFLSTLPTTAPKRPTPSGTAMPIKGLIPGMAVHFARCCHPMRGDRIVGIVSTGKGVTVHTIDCDTLENFADTPERWIEVSWSEGEEAMKSFTGRLNMTMLNESGALASVSMVIAKSGGNIQNLRITSRTTDFWHMLIDVQVDDTKHLNNIMASLRATSQVIEVERGKPQ
jgi:GTP pyrophosphokinase